MGNNHSYKLVLWDFHGVIVPMLEGPDMVLYATTSTVCDLLRLTPHSMRNTLRRHPDAFHGLTVTDCNAKEFLQEHRDRFGIQRVRDDSRLWDEHDLVSFAMLSRSSVANEFREKFNVLIREQTRRHYVHRDQFDQVVTELAVAHANNRNLQDRLTAMEDKVQWLYEQMKVQAGLSGKSLALHKGAKTIFGKN